MSINLFSIRPKNKTLTLSTVIAIIKVTATPINRYKPKYTLSPLSDQHIIVLFIVVRNPSNRYTANTLEDI